MRLAEPIETTGMFWLPGKPDTQLSGVLKISDSSEITVELAGMFGNPLVTPERLGFPSTSSEDDTALVSGRIVGVLQKGGGITLDGCFWQHVSSSFGSGLSRSIVHADIAYVGAEYEEEEEALFSEISFPIEGLNAWLSISGIEIEQDRANRGGLIRFQMPDEISINLPCDAELKFSFGLSFPVSSVLMTRATVQQTALALVKLREPRPIGHFLSSARKLCAFLTLALDQAVSIQSITGYLIQEMSDKRSRRIPINVYGQFAPWPERRPTTRWHDALFRYPDVTSRLHSTVGKWFENYETFESAFNLYFASRTQSSQFLDTKVLWLTQALETLHRRSSKETEMSEEEFRNLRELVTQNCPQNRRQWLYDRLHYANELSFRHRIEKLLEPWEHWFGNREKRRAFVNMVCDTRNYLTHYDEATTRNRASGSDELFDLFGKLEVLFQLHLLNLIGLDDSSIDSIVQENRRIRGKLGVQAS